MRTPNRLENSGRRRLLRAVGAGLAAGTSASTAGCLASMPTLGQQIRYADVDVPTSGEPIYREWIPARSALEHADGGWRTVRYATPNAMGEDVVGATDPLPEQVLRARLDYLGVGYGTYDHVLSVGPVTVCLGSFDAATVRDTVLETGYEERGDYAGYDLFERTDLTRGVAVRDGAVLFRHRADASGPLDPADLEVVIDAEAGRVLRRADEDDAFDAVSRATGSHPTVQLFEGWGPIVRDLSEGFAARSSSMAYAYDEEYVYHRTVCRFEAGAGLTAREVEDVLTRQNRVVEADGVEVVIDEPFLWVDLRESHEEFRSRVGDDRRYPQITWGVSVDGDGTEFTVSHDGGGPVDTDRLTLYLDSRSRVEPGIAPQFDDEFGVLEPGDSLTVDSFEGDRDDSVALLYSPPETNDGTVMVRFVPERVAQNGE
ncbi:hypothetical protein [Natrialba sp. INN-245]|uniref:hypothetical protein n=1 Tax=Natrialba sp. INN-245 TaxID=2690967 RepID=UPI0013107955|nr:hypothetical protein [Natrialba sp. INN-245]MWV40223.1 hypothetical protein [Natrialba sp. INN-245]